MTSPAPLTPRQWWRLGVSAYLPTTVSMVGFGAVAPLVALTALDLGASVATSAFIVGLQGIGTLVGALPAGMIADRIGEKRAMVGANLVDCLVLLMAFYATRIEVLGIAMFITGLSGAMFGLARQSYITEAVPYDVRARALSTLGGVFRIGSFLGPLAGAAIVAHWNLSVAYLFASGLSLLAGILTATLPDMPIAHDQPEDAQLSLFTLLFSHVRVFATIGVGAASIQLVRTARDALLPLWGESINLDASTTSLLFALSSGVDMTLFYFGGAIMDRFGRRWVAVPAMIIMGGCFVFLPLTTSVVGIALVAVLLGLGNGISSGVVMTMGSDASPEIGRARFLAGWRLTAGLGQALAPLLITAVSAAVSLGAASMGIGALGLAGAVWLWKWVPGQSLPRIFMR